MNGSFYHGHPDCLTTKSDPPAPWILQQCALFTEAINAENIQSSLKSIPVHQDFTVNKLSLSDGRVRKSKLLFVEGTDNVAHESCVIIVFKTSDWRVLSGMLNQVNSDPRNMNDSLSLDPSTLLAERGQSVRLDYLFECVQKKKHVVLAGHSQGNLRAITIMEFATKDIPVASSFAD